MGRPKTRVEDIKSIRWWWVRKERELAERGCLAPDGRIKSGSEFSHISVKKGRPRKERRLSFTEILCMIR